MSGIAIEMSKKILITDVKFPDQAHSLYWP